MVNSQIRFFKALSNFMFNLIIHLRIVVALFLVMNIYGQKTEADGPYVVETDLGREVYKVWVTLTKEEQSLSDSLQLPLKVNIDLEEQSFMVSIKRELAIYPSIHTGQKALVAISDIEGNFDPFTRLLKATGVVNENLEWSFGKGHLVLTGDFFDRGDMVTECLWLIYKLEQDAKETGGHVHFILGNHETMNLQGDMRYVHPKYYYSAKALGRPLSKLYSEDTELGRWLRTKNTIEKIGNILFVHGGISNEVNDLGLNLDEINAKMRPHYDEYKRHENDTIQTLMWGKGPLWFRGYYGEEPILETVDATLELFDVDHIVTGHTVVADTISTHYNGKVINIDTPHAKGMSEALLVEGDNFYRVDIEGNKIPLFKNRKKRSD